MAANVLHGEVLCFGKLSPQCPLPRINRHAVRLMMVRDFYGLLFFVLWTLFSGRHFVFCSAFYGLQETTNSYYEKIAR